MVQDKQLRVTLIRFVLSLAFQLLQLGHVRPGRGGRSRGPRAGMTLSSIKSAMDGKRRADLGGAMLGGTGGRGAVVLAEQPHRSSSGASSRSRSRSRSHERSTLVSFCRRAARATMTAA